MQQGRESQGRRQGRDKEVQAELVRLRGASDTQLRANDSEQATRRIAWYQTVRDAVRESTPLETAYRVLLCRLGIHADEAPVVKRDDTSITFHSMNFCPTLEACRILGLDTRRVCRFNESSTDALVRRVNPKLTFSRNYKRIRPYSEFCEESISYKSEAERHLRTS